MSYARFSSDEFQSDVYLYEDCNGGYSIHVADNRPVIDRSKLPYAPDIDQCMQSDGADSKGPDWQKYFARERALMAELKTCKREKINDPEAGENYHVGTLEEMITIVERLKAKGFHIPAKVIPRLKLEIAIRDGYSSGTLEDYNRI